MKCPSVHLPKPNHLNKKNIFFSPDDSFSGTIGVGGGACEGGDITFAAENVNKFTHRKKNSLTDYVLSIIFTDKVCTNE